MKTIWFLLFITLLAACSTQQNQVEPYEPPNQIYSKIVLPEPKKRVFLPTVERWDSVDHKHVILWRSPSKPILVLTDGSVPLSNFRSLTAINLDRQGQFITTYDHINIGPEGGRRIGIKLMWELTREQARTLLDG